MKNNKINKNKYKKKRIAVITILAIVLLCLIIFVINKNALQKIAQGGYALNIGKESIDISKVISAEPNVPVVGAGMIPIKWNSNTNLWEITTKDDESWYDYSNGFFANVMLSDGVYQSELRYDMTGKKLAEKNIGTQILPNELGSIFTWIPRFTYNESQIEFLKDVNILEYTWKTESCFNLEKYGPDSLDYGFTGIWIGQKEFANATEVEDKNKQMSLEDNIEGLIANEQVTTISDSEKTATEKLISKYENTNNTMVQSTDTMQNRQVIKIINTNNKLPIIGAYTIIEDKIKVYDKYSKNGIKLITDKDGNKLEQNEIQIDEDETIYTCYIVDNIGNIRKYKICYGVGKPALKGFNKNNTFYVLYDENGQEDSSIPIGEKISEDKWYNYDNQQWANIVVRNAGSEAYYTWIPRYMYKIDEEKEETIDAKIVDLENTYTDPKTGKSTNLNRTEYKLPEAFTWEDPDDSSDVIQLTGFWASKYKLRDAATTVPEIAGGAGIIRVNNILETYGAEGYTYELYLIKDGKRIVYNGSTYIEGTEPIELTGNYLFENVEPGEYGVNIIIKDESNLQVKAIGQVVTVLEKMELDPPDLTGFNENLTFYVTYDENGNESSYIPIGDEAPKDWYNYDNQQWANIVVRNEGNEAYYTWIPRYEYKLEEANEKTIAQIIPKTKETPDVGYKIPEAFTWEDPNNPDEVVQLSGFWTSKYKLRDLTTTRLYATIAADETKVRVSNIIPLVTTSNTFKISLIQNGKILQTVDINANGEHTFDITDKGVGTYSVSVTQTDETGTVIAGFAKQFEVYHIDPPDLTGFRVDTTYIVTYDSEGNENTQTLQSVLEVGAQIKDNILISGKVDMTKVNKTWFDYSKQYWANIKVENNDKIAYFTWIPRYEYQTNAIEERISAILIPKDKVEADEGYQIPEAFTWEDPNNSNAVIQLSGFWASKYKLRE